MAKEPPGNDSRERHSINNSIIGTVSKKKLEFIQLPSLPPPSTKWLLLRNIISILYLRGPLIGTDRGCERVNYHRSDDLLPHCFSLLLFLLRFWRYPKFGLTFLFDRGPRSAKLSLSLSPSIAKNFMLIADARRGSFDDFCDFSTAHQSFEIIFPRKINAS